MQRSSKSKPKNSAVALGSASQTHRGAGIGSLSGYSSLTGALKPVLPSRLTGGNNRMVTGLSGVHGGSLNSNYNNKNETAKSQIIGTLQKKTSTDKFKSQRSQANLQGKSMSSTKKLQSSTMSGIARTPNRTSMAYFGNKNLTLNSSGAPDTDRGPRTAEKMTVQKKPNKRQLNKSIVSQPVFLTSPRSRQTFDKQDEEEYKIQNEGSIDVPSELNIPDPNNSHSTPNLTLLKVQGPGKKREQRKSRQQRMAKDGGTGKKTRGRFLNAIDSVGNLAHKRSTENIAEISPILEKSKSPLKAIGRNNELEMQAYDLSFGSLELRGSQNDGKEKVPSDEEVDNQDDDWLGDGADMKKPRGAMFSQREVEAAKVSARKREKPNLQIDPDDHLEDAEVAPNAKIQLYQTHASPLVRPQKTNTFETLQTKVIRAASNNSGRLVETSDGQVYLQSTADDARKNKTAEKSRLFQNNKTNRDRLSNPIGNQITELKLQQKMYSFTKHNSPKRAGGMGASFTGGNTVKKAQVSLERKDNRGSLKSDMRKPIGGTKDLQGFSTALSNRKSEVVEVSSQSFPYLRRDLNSKESQDQLGTQNQGSRIASRPAADAKQTPGKFKKSTYLNSYKKGGNVQNLASAKQMLNQSMTSINSGKNSQMHAQSRTNNTLGQNTPNNNQGYKAQTTGNNGQRTGLHQDPEAEDTAPKTVGIALPESRQMVNSPFKARPKNVEGQNYAQMTVSLAAKQATLTAKKAPGASRMSVAGKQPKNDRSLQRGSYQVNSAIRPRGGQQRQTSTQKDREDAYGAARVFNSKSPSKKSLQLQQILKSINLQTSTSASQQKKRTVAATQNTSTDHKNSTSKSSSLIRNFIHQVSQPGQHAHTKSYRALAGGSGSMNPSYQGASHAQHKSSTAFGHQSTSVTSAAGVIAKSNVNTASGSSFRNSHVNPYIQSKGKQKPKDVSNTVARGFARRAERDLEKEDAGAPLSDRAGITGLTGHNLTQHYLGGGTEDNNRRNDAGEGTQNLLDRKAATALAQSLKQNTLANNVNRNVGKVLTASKKLIQSKASGKPIYSPAGTGQMKVLTSVTERSDQAGYQGAGQAALRSQRRGKNERLHPDKGGERSGGFQLADTSNNYLKLGAGGSRPSETANRHAFTSGVAAAKMSSSVVVTNTSEISEENQESDEREGSNGRNVSSIVMDNLELLQDDEEPDSAENIHEVHIHQSSQIKTPKQISDMGTVKKGVIKSSIKSKPAHLGSASKTGLANAGPSSASKKQIIGDYPKAGGTRNAAPQKKETKYAAISFNDSAQGDNGSESGQKININLNDKANANQNAIGLYKSQRSQKQNIAYENPYQDEFGQEEREDAVSPSETVSKDNLVEPNAAMDSDRLEWQGLHSPAPQSIHTGGASPSQSQHQSRTSKVMNESSWTNDLDEPSYPISATEFLEQYQDCMLEEEIQELGSGERQFDTVYYAGSISGRSREDLEICQTLNEERRKTFEEMKANAEDTGNGEFQGNPVFDNHEGYYKVQIGEHIAYRYEILKVLGKGSFAQVVQCRDHKDPNQAIYAVKITRNTEMDHKFAHKEAQYLRYIMQEDPHDKHNIVRMLDQCYFRDHHCFVFELLHTDLFEHLKATGFVGFSTDKIRDYAHQILQGLVFLEKHKIIHCDLKPENILCVDTMCRNLKVVDFGSGCFRDEQIYTYVQSRFYRSPEVILRVKYSEKVDIWSLGCILAELYTGEPLFPGNNEQEQLELIMELCGMPPETMIDKSRKKDHYFDTDYSPFLIEDERLGILRIPSSRPLREAVPCEDNHFLDFVLQCLEIDPETRFSASEAMEHPWIKAAQEEKLHRKSSHATDARSAPKQKPAKRMGQNESAEELYQPQILREKEVREREGEECPTEYSPEREVIAQRKKPAQKLNKESFGIKLNNLNIAPSEGKLNTTKKNNNKGSNEVKVSDFIAEQKSAGHYNSQLPGDNDVMQNSVVQSSGKKIGQARNSSDNVSNISSLQNSSQNSNGAMKNSQISLIVDKDSSVMQQPSALYYSGANPKNDPSRVSNPASSKSKSIIPDIDYTNKYVRRQTALINSRSDGQGENSFVADEINDVSQELAKEENSVIPQDQNASQSSLELIQAGVPQQPHQPEPKSPFKSKFVNKFSLMEQIAQFDHDGDTTVMSQSYMGRNSQYDMASQIGSIYPYKKKKPVTNNFMQPSQ